MSYEIDRDQNVEPSLKEMAGKALEILESHSDKGFFLMIEGSRIDMAAHENDPGTHVHEILEYHETVAVVRKFIDKHPGTVMISVSDHETGGLSLALQKIPNPIYRWYPDVISRIKNSSYILAQRLKSYWDDDRTSFINKTILNDGLGINDFTQDDLTYLNQNLTSQEYIYYLANMTSWRAELGWATHGHSGVDVNLYAYGMNIEAIRGNHENTEIGEFIKNYLNLDLDSITLELNSNNDSFHLSNVNISNYNADHLEHYHHL
ncbi:8364_t:CDS:2 [Diversispora eburnea]|uniref:alkaline phosphatase n=1 Tax=Diversispora eburnea TaxID=1213867 RepID=A0A9N9FSQ4_9GLOM|nr:8364_t:CDS:2 [Diversispora eburnea]